MHCISFSFYVPQLTVSSGSHPSPYDRARDFFGPSTIGSAAVVPDHQDLPTANPMSSDVNGLPSNPQYSESLPHNLERICHERGLSNDTISNAKFEKGEEKTLLGLVLNRRYMAQVLVALGFQEHFDDAFAPAKVVTLMDQKFSASDIVKCFGWSADSYRNKTSWFGWAKEAAKSQKWSGVVPNEGELYLGFV
jgi:hypothetical protein